MEKNSLKKFFPTSKIPLYYLSYDELVGSNRDFYAISKWLTENALNKNSKNNILDVGCANGTLASKLAENNSVDAIDVDEIHIDIAKNRALYKTNPNFEVLDVKKLSDHYKDKKFDTIISTYSPLGFACEDVDSLTRVLDIFSENLAKNGSIFFEVSHDGNQKKQYAGEIFHYARHMKINSGDEFLTYSINYNDGSKRKCVPAINFKINKKLDGLEGKICEDKTFQVYGNDDYDNLKNIKHVLFSNDNGYTFPVYQFNDKDLTKDKILFDKEQLKSGHEKSRHYDITDDIFNFTQENEMYVIWNLENNTYKPYLCEFNDKIIPPKYTLFSQDDITKAIENSKIKGNFEFYGGFDKAKGEYSKEIGYSGCISVLIKT